MKAPLLAAAPSTWTGIYVGGNIGGGIGTNSWSYYPPLSAGILSISPPGASSGLVVAGTGTTSGALGGVQLGFNYQTGWVVWGLEGEFDWSGLKGNMPLATASEGYYTLANTVKTNYISTVTGRVGGVFHEDMLIYLKGGVAFAQNNYAISATDSFGIASGNYSSMNDNRTGWTVGFGTEYRFDPHWSAKIEYDYIDFASKNLSFPAGSGGACNPFGVCSTSAVAFDVPQTIHTFKLGLNYKIW
jgi:outer membrane immunogenic protein